MLNVKAIMEGKVPGRGGHVKSQNTLMASRTGSYLDGTVELLQRTSRPLPAADVHTEGIPPHD